MKHPQAPHKSGKSAAAPTPLADSDMERLQSLLDAVPTPLEPLDLCALDGFIAGVVLQPKPVAAEQWLRWVTDVEGRPAPASPALDELRALARRRHAEVELAISDRDWFDPWVFAMDDKDDAAVDADSTPPDEGHDSEGAGDSEGESEGESEGASPVQQAMLPWVAGFAAAMDAFPALMNSTNPELIEPLALLYLHFDAEDLEDADALLAVIETLEPPPDLAEAVQDLVRALMLMADVTRPLEPVKAAGRTPARKAPAGLHPRGGNRGKAGQGGAKRARG